jgi:hypothetical protein
MDYKKEFKKLIVTVKKYRKDRGLSFKNEDIASILGYTRTYFSGLTGESGTVTEAHIKKVKLHFPKVFDNHTYNSVVGEDEAEYIKQSSTLNISIGDLYERVIRAESILSVLKDNDVYLFSKVDGLQPASVRADMEEAIAKVSKQQLGELQKKK